MTPSPRHRQQTTLGEVLDFDTAPPLEADVRLRAEAEFCRIVNHFESTETTANRRSRSYNRPLLVRLTYNYVRSAESQDIFLRSFFGFMRLPLSDADRSQLGVGMVTISYPATSLRSGQGAISASLRTGCLTLLFFSFFFFLA